MNTSNSSDVGTYTFYIKLGLYDIISYASNNFTITIAPPIPVTSNTTTPNTPSIPPY
jgi:hypothetical protein